MNLSVIFCFFTPALALTGLGIAFLLGAVARPIQIWEAPLAFGLAFFLILLGLYENCKLNKRETKTGK